MDRGAKATIVFAVFTISRIQQDVWGNDEKKKTE